MQIQLWVWKKWATLRSAFSCPLGDFSLVCKLFELRHPPFANPLTFIFAVWQSGCISPKFYDLVIPKIQWQLHNYPKCWGWEINSFEVVKSVLRTSVTAKKIRNIMNCRKNQPPLLICELKKVFAALCWSVSLSILLQAFKVTSLSFVLWEGNKVGKSGNKRVFYWSISCENRKYAISWR